MSSGEGLLDGDLEDVQPSRSQARQSTRQQRSAVTEVPKPNFKPPNLSRSASNVASALSNRASVVTTSAQGSTARAGEVGHGLVVIVW